MFRFLHVNRMGRLRTGMESDHEDWEISFIGV